MTTITAPDKLQGYRIELIHLAHTISQEKRHFRCPHNLIEQQRLIHNEIVRLKDNKYGLGVK